MNKFFLLTLAAILWHNAFAEPVKVDSKISHVTVFLKGAQVTRTSTANILPGKTELLFPGLSDNLDPNSIQVRAKGNFTVLSVNHRINYLEIPQKKEEIEALKKKRDELLKKISKNQYLRSVYQSEEQLIMDNTKLGGSQTGVDVMELEKASNFLRQRLTEINNNKLELELELAELNESLTKINRQLSRMNAIKERSTSEIMVRISSKTSGKAEFELSYLIQNAGWTPFYDLKVRDIASDIEANLQAKVYQLSGFDWEKVNLILSTGDPSVGGVKPVLRPWYLSFGFARPNIGYMEDLSEVQIRENQILISGKVLDENGNPLSGVRVSGKETQFSTTTNSSGNYALQVPVNTKELSFVQAGYVNVVMPIHSSRINLSMSPLLEARPLGATPEVSKKKSRTDYYEAQEMLDEPDLAAPPPVTGQQQATSYEYGIDIPYTIKSDGNNYSVDIQIVTMPAEYRYLCIPKIKESAFLLARFSGWDQYKLLSGSANLYFEGTYLGKTYLNTEITGDTLEISLGQDADVNVSRTSLKEFTQNQFIGPNKKVSRGFEISIRNSKQVPINLLLKDQFPVSTHEDIKVKYQEYSGAKLDEEAGFLSWEMQLEPGEKKEVLLRYEVTYPKKQNVVLE